MIMNSKAFLFLFIFLFGSLFPGSADTQFLKLEEAAVSKLPDSLIAPDLKSVTVAPDGSVFAFAGKPGGQDCFVVKFDKDLNFLKRIGRSGKGPSEFSTRANGAENRLSVDTDGNLYVFDHNPPRFIIFDNDGNYKKDILMGRDYSKSIGRISRVKAIGRDTFVGLQYRRELPPIGLLFTIKPPRIKVKYPFVGERIYLLLRGTVQFNRDFCGANCLFDADAEYIVFGDTQIYRFHVYDRDGNLKFEIEDKSRVMGSFSDGEMEEIIENHLTPKNGYSQIMNSVLAQFNADKSHYRKTVKQIKRSKNIIADILIAGERLYVFPVRGDITVKDKFPVEIYDLRGRMIKKGYFNKRPAKIWKNYVFFYDRDEEDNPLILKYRILDFSESSKKILTSELPCGKKSSWSD